MAKKAGLGTGAKKMGGIGKANDAAKSKNKPMPSDNDGDEGMPAFKKGGAVKKSKGKC